MPKFFTAILICFAALTAHAQTWELGGALGGYGYIGDIDPTNPLKLTNWSAQLFGKRNFNGYLSARLNYSWGTISGADSTSGNQQQQDRNLSFHTPLKELSLMAEFNFMKYIPDAGKNKYTPYVFVGIGNTWFAPRTNYNGDEVSLRPLRTEGQASDYRKSAITVPYGAGFKYNIGGKWTIATELGYRYAFSDYLDDVSGLYPQPSALPNPLSVVLSDRSGERYGNFIGVPGSQRGDQKPHDSFMFLGVTLTYTFVTAKCYYEE